MKLIQNMKNKITYFSLLLIGTFNIVFAQSVRLPNLNDTFKAADLAHKPVNADIILMATKNLLFSLEKKQRNKREDTLLVLASERLAYLYYSTRIPQKNPDPMLVYSQKLLKYAKHCGYTINIFRAYDYIATVYAIKTDYQKALDISLEAYKLTANLKGADLILTTYPLTRIASSYQLLRDYDNSLIFHLKALDIIELCKKNDFKTGITKEKLRIANTSFAYKYDDIGVIYAEQKNFSEALKYYQLAYNYAKKSEFLAQTSMAIKHEMDNLEIQYLSLKKLKRYDLALIAYENYMTLNDSITNRRKLTQVLNLQRKLETEKEKAEFDKRQLLQKVIIDSSQRANEILLLKAENNEVEKKALFEKNKNDELARKLQIEQLRTTSEKTQLLQQNHINSLNV